MASKAKKKGGWKSSDWPRAGEGKVSKTGFCSLHTSHFCPCAAPSLYRVGRR